MFQDKMTGCTVCRQSILLVTLLKTGSLLLM